MTVGRSFVGKVMILSEYSMDPDDESDIEEGPHELDHLSRDDSELDSDDEDEDENDQNDNAAADDEASNSPYDEVEEINKFRFNFRYFNFSYFLENYHYFQMPLPIEDIFHCQNMLKHLNRDAAFQIFDLEDKYNQLRKPIYVKRAASIEKIPYFWKHALLNHPLLSGLFDADDHEWLDCLKIVEVEDCNHAWEGFRIKFVFGDEGTPAFSNTELVKEFKFKLSSPLLTTSTSTIIWCKEGWGRKVNAHFPRNFFTWFQDNSNAEDDIIAEVIKNDLWMNAVRYFKTGLDKKEKTIKSSDDEALIKNKDNDQNGDGDHTLEE